MTYVNIQKNIYKDMIMPHRSFVAQELAEFVSAIAHPFRIRIIEELRDDEQSVQSLQEALDLPQSAVSQQLAVLRSHQVVSVRREGRLVFYRLRDPRLAAWLAEGMQFLEPDEVAAKDMRKALASARAEWLAKPPRTTKRR
jgi:ArsR family transcriptional regulator